MNFILINIYTYSYREVNNNIQHLKGTLSAKIVNYYLIGHV